MLSLFIAAALGNVVTLDATTESVEVTTSSTASTDYTVSYVDLSSGVVAPGSAHGNIASITTTTVLAAPAASTQRAVAMVSLCNVGATSQVVTLKHDTSGTERVLGRAALGPLDCARWSNDGVPSITNSVGVPRMQSDTPGFSGLTLSFAKPATATDAAGYSYAYGKDTGVPGAYSLGTPGLNGVVTACDVVGTSGSGGALSVGTHRLPDPPTGGWYLTRFGLTAAVVNTYELVDLVWYNTGIVVTTTTAQAITTPTFPARDINGGAAGEGYNIALLTTTANTNAAVISNTTVSYTNSAGTAGRTAVFFGAVGFQAPATPVIGTLMRFQLQAGDTGVQSIQSVTLGTSYGAGALSLLVYRPLAVDGVALANGPSGSLVSRAQLNPGVRVWNDTCFWRQTIGSTATTAPGIYGGIIELMER